jgi:NTP pyrophosphatase (non-canonical NTP hydrolase)
MGVTGERVAAELADVLIYLTSLAEMTGVDLSAEVARKLARNAVREYQRGADGVLRRVSDPAAAAG